MKEDSQSSTALATKLPVIVPMFKNLLVVMDPGRDQDDEDVLVFLNRLIRLEILNMMGVVANLAPSAQRARLAKGTLNQLGQSTIPVGIGTSCNQPEDDGLEYQFAVSYLAETTELTDGKELILKTLREAKPKSIVLLLISGLTDAAAVLREYQNLFATTVRRVAIMGGVVVKDEQPVLDASGRLQADMSAQNNAFDKEAAAFLYQQLQELGIPTTTVSRHAAVASKVSRSVYDEMAATGHPIGIRLLEAQKKAIEELWQRACLPDGDAKRMGLPGRCDKTWFVNTFCGGEGADRKSEDSIWDLIKTFNLYDPATLVATIPNLREHFFAPFVCEVHGVEHMVIGVSAKNHNVRDTAGLADFMKNMLVGSLVQSLQDNEKAVA
jgi:Inosine-uridine nucleoside N-ribohydrolase